MIAFISAPEERAWQNFAQAASEQLQLVDSGIERQPVVRRKPVTTDRQAMFAGRITFVALPTVFGEISGEALHIFVAVGLGQHRRGGNIRIFAVPLDDAAIRNIERRAEPVAVDRQKSRTDRQLRDRQRHPFERSVQDVDLIDPLGRNGLHDPGKGLALDDRTQQIALTRGHLLRIVQQRMAEVRRQHHRSGKNRPCEAPAPRLVAPGFGQLFLVAVLQHPKQSYYRTISMPPSKTDKPAPISAKTREPGVCAETLRTSPKYRTHFCKIKNIGNHIQFYTDVSIAPDLPEPPRNSSERQEAGFSTEP